MTASVNQPNFTQASVTWPRPTWARDNDALMDEVLISSEDQRGTVAVRWYKMSSGTFARIEAFNDGWALLNDLGWLLDVFHRGDVSPAELIAGLKDHGWVPSEYHGQLERDSERRLADQAGPKDGIEAARMAADLMRPFSPAVAYDLESQADVWEAEQ